MLCNFPALCCGISRLMKMKLFFPTLDKLFKLFKNLGRKNTALVFLFLSFTSKMTRWLKCTPKL